MNRPLLVFLIAAAAVACSSVDDAATSESNVEVWPEAAENLGFIEVVVPAADKPIDPVHIEFHQNMQGAFGTIPEKLELALGRKQQARKGKGVLRLSWDGGYDEMDVSVQAQRTTTVRLGLLSLRYQNPTTLAGPAATLGPTPANARPSPHVLLLDRSWPLPPGAGFAGDGAAYAPLLPMKHSFHLLGPSGERLQEQEVDLALGAVRELSFDRGPLVAPSPARVRVQWPARTTADGFPGTSADCSGSPNGLLTIVGKGDYANTPSPVDPGWLCWEHTKLQVHASGDDFVQRAMRPAAGQELVLYPLSRARYELVLNAAFTIPITPELGKTTDVRVERIDVHDIVLTKADGSTVTHRGSWTLSHWVTGRGFERVRYGKWDHLDVVLSTEQGMDVPPGLYRVDVSCNVDCGGPRSYELDLR